MEISCEHVWREVSNYLDGEVDPALRAAVDEHVRGCKRCAAVLDGTRNVVQLIADERVMELPLGYEQRLRQRLAAERPAAQNSYWSWLVLATAAILLAAALAIGSGSPFREPRLRSEMARPAAGVPAALMVFVAADGKTFHVAGCRFLHDKTKVRGIPASEALREGYVPCVHCMKQYLSAGLMLPGGDQRVEQSPVGQSRVEQSEAAPELKLAQKSPDSLRTRLAPAEKR
jgi:Putative zinc-finger